MIIKNAEQFINRTADNSARDIVFALLARITALEDKLQDVQRYADVVGSNAIKALQAANRQIAELRLENASRNW